MAGRELPLPGGYDKNGNLSRDPAAIMASRRTLPIGYWKGSGLAMMMDILVSCLSNGRTVAAITHEGQEYSVSQFFLCLSPATIEEEIIQEIINYAKSSEPVDEGAAIRYPGEQTLIERRKSEKNGVHVNDLIWEQVKNL
jgi:3-dehydro-L-gulonate 2-dehydrogenase